MDFIKSQHTVALLVLSTLFSTCVFVTTGAFATTMTITDTEINGRLKHTLSKDEVLSSLKINPIVNLGVVTLKGRVSSADQAMRLIELTEQMQGVKDVNTKQLILKTNNRPISVTDNIYIMAKLKDLYEKNKIFGDHNLNKLGVSVDATDGVVTLSGGIKERLAHITPEQYREQVKTAIKLAKQTKGVKSVNHDDLVFIIEYIE